MLQNYYVDSFRYFYFPATFHSLGYAEELTLNIDVNDIKVHSVFLTLTC